MGKKTTVAQLAASARWHARHPEYKKAWYLANRETVLAKHRAKYFADPHKYRNLASIAGRKSRTGASDKEYQEMVAWQDGKCAICLKPAKLVVDHDHRLVNKQEAMRGLLCDMHNKGLGHFSDDPELLRAAADYLDGGR